MEKHAVGTGGGQQDWKIGERSWEDLKQGRLKA